MKFTLRGKLFALTTAVIVLITADTTLWRAWRGRGERLDAALAEAERLARSIASLKHDATQDWPAYQRFIGGLVSSNPDVVYIALYDEHDALRAWALNPEWIEGGAELAASRRSESEVVRRLHQGEVAAASAGDLRTASLNLRDGERVLGSVHVGISLVAIHGEIERALRRDAGLALVWVVLFGALSFLLARRLTNPIEKLNVAMAAVKRGDLEQRVRPQSHDELGELTRSFNDMAEGLRERRIIEQLGQELASTFRRERLAVLVRERLGTTLGAARTRLFVEEPGARGRFRELDGEGSLALDRDCAELLVSSEDGVGAERCPPAMREALSRAGIAPADLLVPLGVQGRLMGFLAFRIAGGASGLGGAERHFVGILARQAALALDNAALYEELREQERLKGELEAAREVQRRLLPARMPALSGWEIAGLCRPALEVGGDYFDFFPAARGLGIVVADVSGKGSSASMYAAQLKGMMLSLSSSGRAPREVLVEVNRLFHPSFARRSFASVFFAVLDAGSGALRFARAGHSPLLRLPARGPVEVVPSGGIAVGIDAGALFDKLLEEKSVTLEPGDTVVLYTDGVTDALGPGCESFGLARLLELLGRERERPADDLLARVLEELERFTGGTAQFDDLTLLLVRRGRNDRPGAA